MSSRPGPRLLTLLPLTGVRLLVLPPRVLGGISTPSNSDEVTYYSPHFHKQSQRHKSRTHAMALAGHTHKHKSGTSWNISTSRQITSVILSYTMYTYLTVTVWLLEDHGNALVTLGL